MPSDKFKFSNAKSSMIKKLYNSHKKLLGRSDKSDKNQKVEEKATKIYNKNDYKEDLSENIYENLQISSTSSHLFKSDVTFIEISDNDSKSISNCDELSLSTCSSSSNGGKTSIYLSPDASICSNLENNVTIIEVSEPSPKKESFQKNKLEIVIDNFDKIYNEHKELQNTAKPKLVKSKTCSIIESKCILKKKPEKENQSKTLIKTKSLFNLDVDDENLRLSFPNADILKLVSEFNQLKQAEKAQLGPNEPAKVKEIVKKINNITSKTNLTDKKLGYRQSKIPKATSCNDLSTKKLLTVSPKIPIKSNLNKTFPSTPNNLEKLDLTLGCTKNARRVLPKAQSTLSLVKTNSKECLIKNKPKIIAKNLNTKLRSEHNLKNNIVCVNKEEIETKRIELKNDKKLLDIDKSNQKNTSNKVLSKNGEKHNFNVDKEEIDVNRNEIKRTQEIDKNNQKDDQKCKVLIKTSKNLKNSNLTSKVDKNINEGVDKVEIDKIRNVKEKKLQEINKNITIKENDEKDQQQKGAIQKSIAKKEGPFKIKPQDLRKTSNLTPKPNVTSKNIRVEEKPNQIDLKKVKSTLKCTKPKTKIIKETKSNELNKLNDSDLSTFGEIKLDLKPKFVEIIDGVSTECVKRSLKRSETYKISEKNHLKRLQNTEDNLKLSKELIYQDLLSEDFNSDDSGNISNDLEFEELQFKPSTIIFSSNESLNGINKLQNEEEKIFFRTGILTQLESQRDEKLAGMVINLQANCRGFLARKKLSQRKLQDLAVRCIQRNVRKFMLVRDWAWWRLLVRVTPLLNVHRTEEELKLKTEELELLKMKLEKIEADRNNLKNHNDKLEAKLSEMTVDLAEEHSTSTLAAERLDVETAERIRLERELTDVQQKNKNLQSASEKLEMELLYARSDLNHHQQTSDDDEEDGENEPVYKQRYERVVRELEFTKRRLRQQHEDDLEQLVGLKKQLEKKLTDAYEEVEEQRQVVGQWKRKVQKLTSEMGDIKLLLEEQISRNNILEKKQRKFDSEIQNVQEELKKERQSKDRLSREKEILTAEKFGMEGTVGDLRMELDMKEEKLHALQKELDELTFGGKTEEEVAILRKQKIDCERRLHDQEEELDELAGQVQLLEQAKLKLEMSLEQQRKAAKKEAQQHEEELEEVRCNAQKKVKALEAQLENEHEERTVLLREKHELERRLASALENDRNDKAVDEAVVQRLKRDLKRTKALLRDTQMQLDRQRAENPSKTLIRQLRNQIEDLECARTTALKTKQTLETDLSEIQSQLEETTRIKCDLEEKYNSNLREKSDLQNQVEENEEELAEVLKKYKTTVQQMSLDQIALQEQVALVAELETEKAALKEQLAEMSSRLETVENMGDASSNVLVRKNEMKVKELEHKLDLEQTTRQRLEVQISRLKEAVEKLQNEIGVMRNKEQTGQELIRKLQRQIRELRDEHNTALTKEGESILKRKEIEKRYEALEAETTTVRGDLRLALKRIEDLQAVIQNDLEDSSEQSDSEIDSLSSEDSVNSFLKHHKLSVKPSNIQIESTKPRSTSVNSIKDTSYA